MRRRRRRIRLRNRRFCSIWHRRKRIARYRCTFARRRRIRLCRQTRRSRQRTATIPSKRCPNKHKPCRIRIFSRLRRKCGRRLRSIRRRISRSPRGRRKRRASYRRRMYFRIRFCRSSRSPQAPLRRTTSIAQIIRSFFSSAGSPVSRVTDTRNPATAKPKKADRRSRETA